MLLAIVVIVISRSVARTQALQDAERVTSAMAESIVQPLLTGALSGNAADGFTLDREAASRIAEGYLTELAVWTADGHIIWANDPSEMEGIQAPPLEVTAAIVAKKVSSGYEDHPEVTSAGFNPDNPGFVEVYVPMTLGNGQAVALEAYFDWGQVNDRADSLMWRIIPLVLVPLLILQFFQIPVVVRLARRVQRFEAEQSRLLDRAVFVSEREQARIAADLHAGPIMKLAGISHRLGLLAAELPDDDRRVVNNAQRAANRAEVVLRRGLSGLGSANLSADRLCAAIDELAGPLRDRGIAVTLDCQVPPGLGEAMRTVLFQVTRESLANALEHASATTVSVSLRPIPADDPARPPSIELMVSDNGIGVAPERVDRRAEGHLGLRLLKDRVHEIGGELTLTSGPTGTTVLVWVASAAIVVG